jgi:hypothetical protein
MESDEIEETFSRPKRSVLILNSAESAPLAALVPVTGRANRYAATSFRFSRVWQ